METWLSDTPELGDDLEDLRGRAQLGAITRNRPVNAQGFSHGGVALFFAEDKCSFKEVVVNNPSAYEVLVRLCLVLAAHRGVDLSPVLENDPLSETGNSFLAVVPI